jgi:hypothetical protein
MPLYAVYNIAFLLKFPYTWQKYPENGGSMFLCISINFFCYYMASEPRIKTTNGV